MNILLVDDHTLFRHGLKFLLADLGQGISFVESHNIAGALALTGQPVDLVLLDLALPDAVDMDGLTRMRDAFPDSVIVVLSSEDGPARVRQAIELGAAGFIPKSSTPAVMVSALRLILAGGIYLPPQVLGLPFGPVAGNAVRPAESWLDKLTDRQREILQLAVQGKSNKVIARELRVSEGTVKQHLTGLFRAMGVTNRTEAVFVAADLGLTTNGPRPA